MRWGFLPALAAALPLAPNMIRLDRACVERDAGGLRLVLYGPSPFESSAKFLCDALTTCEGDSVRDARREY